VKADTRPLVVGLEGLELTDSEREIIEIGRPAGVILFARNAESAEQVRQLVEQIHELETPPFVCVDLEGGMVNRFAALWGPLPSPARSAALGRRAMRALGEAAGAACRSLGIHLDLAPVVDLTCPGCVIDAQERGLAADPERVAALARVFVEGLASWCVTGCLKHFPGLGAVSVDTHEQLPTLDLDRAALEPHLHAFALLSQTVPLVMVGHVVVPALGDPDTPASLSSTVIKRAAALPGSPVILSDDLEMGALAGWGDLPDRVVAALRARNHGVLICRSIRRLPEIVDLLEEEQELDPALRSRVEDDGSRLGTLRRDVLRAAASVPAPDDATVAQLWDLARREAEP